MFLIDKTCYDVAGIYPRFFNKNAKKAVMRQHMKEDIHDLFNGLETREASDDPKLWTKGVSPKVSRGDWEAFSCE